MSVESDLAELKELRSKIAELAEQYRSAVEREEFGKALTLREDVGRLALRYSNTLDVALKQIILPLNAAEDNTP